LDLIKSIYPKEKYKMSDQETQVLEDGIEEAKVVKGTGGSGVNPAETPDPASTGSSKRKADKDGGEKATPKLPGTKAGMIAAMVNTMSGKKLTDLQAMYDGMNEEIEAEDEAIEVGIDVSDDINEMLANGDFSEEFVENIQTIFKAAVEARVGIERAALEEQFDEKIEEELEKVTEEVTSKVDEYLTYAVSEWKEENEVAIETGLRAELAEDFIKGLHSLFTEHYIEVPEEKVDVVEELASKVEELEGKLNKQITENTQLSKEIVGFKVQDSFDEVVEGLADTQVEKMRTFAEGIEYSDEDDFRKKLEVVRENYFPTKAPQAIVEEDLDDPEDQDETVVADPTMSVYADAIRRTIRK
jgi:hypothetical protein